jgi:DNA-binding transcriptional regulator YiaG
MNDETQLQIGDVALMLGRVAHTVRGWERDGRLPEHLRSKRMEILDSLTSRRHPPVDH